MITSRGYFGVGLHNPRDSKNVAHALRACGCFDAAFLGYTGDRYQRSTVDTQKCWRHMPLIQCVDVLDLCPYECTPIAVELDPRAKLLPTFVHPERAYYVFGPEDGSLPESVLARCASIINIPSRFCLNLAAAVNVTLYDRAAKNSLNRTPHVEGIPCQNP